MDASYCASDSSNNDGSGSESKKQEEAVIIQGLTRYLMEDSRSYHHQYHIGDTTNPMTTIRPQMSFPTMSTSCSGGSSDGSLTNQQLFDPASMGNSSPAINFSLNPFPSNTTPNFPSHHLSQTSQAATGIIGIQQSYPIPFSPISSISSSISSPSSSIINSFPTPYLSPPSNPSQYISLSPPKPSAPLVSQSSNNNNNNNNNNHHNNPNNNNSNNSDNNGGSEWMDTMTSSIGLNPFSSGSFNPQGQQQLNGNMSMEEKEEGGSGVGQNEQTTGFDCDGQPIKRQYHRVDNQTKLNDSKYQQRRAKNNEAVRRNRIFRKAKAEETEKKLKDLVSENEQLQYELNLCHIQLRRISKQNGQQEY